MAKKTGTIRRIASKTVAAGREHVAMIISGEETLRQAAGGAIGDLISGSKAKPAKKALVKKASAKKKVAKKKPAAKSAIRKRSKKK